MDNGKKQRLILAPLRGVTIRCFRETFAAEITEAGFTEAVTPFITANAGVDPLKDRELKDPSFSTSSLHLPLTPQFIGKDPAALKDCLLRIKSAGYTMADLNCGCPFPMVRNKGRGSGILRTPDVLRQMLEVGCATMGAGNFSIKTRLGVERTDELLRLMPMINEYPLRYLTLHARTAKQMYEGVCDWSAAQRVIEAARVPLVLNGDISTRGDATKGDVLFLPRENKSDCLYGLMVGRAFIRDLGTRPNARAFVDRYIAASQRELSGDRPVLGRLKELLAYWKDLPDWNRRWNVIKICRTLDELRMSVK